MNFSQCFQYYSVVWIKSRSTWKQKIWLRYLDLLDLLFRERLRELKFKYSFSKAPYHIYEWLWMVLFGTKNTTKLKIILHKVQIRMESFTFSPNFQIEKKNLRVLYILARIFFPESSRSIKLPKKFLENIMVNFFQNFHFCKICLKWAQNG